MIRREIGDDHVCLLVFDRPESGANIFDAPTLDELNEHLDLVENDASLTGLIIASAKKSIFVAGADLKTLLRQAQSGDLRAFIAARWAALVVAGTQHHLTGLPHLGLHLLLLVVGVLFWLPVLGHGQVMPRLRGPAASLYLFLAVPAADLTVVWLMARGETTAVGVMLAAMAPLGIAALAVSWSWILREERLARAGQAAP